MNGFGADHNRGTSISSHPKADVVPGVYYPKRSVGMTLFLTAVAGAILGYAIGVVIAPFWAPAFALGLAMILAGLRTALFVRSRHIATKAKNKEQQNRRVRFEQQYAEALTKGDLDRWKDNA